MKYSLDAKFSDLEGQTLVKIDNSNDEIVTLTTDTGRVYQMDHDQNCCESVWLAETIGDLNDLLNTPILVAEVVSEDGDNDGYDVTEWTFYKLSTIKGSVTLRWCGTSNGYYSTEVSFREVKTGSKT